jgi:hypothetical protein
VRSKRAGATGCALFCCAALTPRAQACAAAGCSPERVGSVDVLSALHEAHPDVRFSWVLGACCSLLAEVRCLTSAHRRGHVCRPARRTLEAKRRVHAACSLVRHRAPGRASTRC